MAREKLLAKGKPWDNPVELLRNKKWDWLSIVSEGKGMIGFIEQLQLFGNWYILKTKQNKFERESLKEEITCHESDTTIF